MRITITLDDDIHAAAKELALTEGISIGEVISTLARKALLQNETAESVRNGIPLLSVKPGASLVTSATVRRLDR